MFVLATLQVVGATLQAVAPPPRHRRHMRNSDVLAALPHEDDERTFVTLTNSSQYIT
jgi:hypothetical protein